MKKRHFTIVLAFLIVIASQGCGARNAEDKTLTADMAYQGVSNYCHEAYDWSPAKDNPEIMYVTMGEETEAEYLVIFRSYTGAFVDFHVDKASGEAAMVERVPTLGIEEKAGSINICDYVSRTGE